MPEGRRHLKKDDRKFIQVSLAGGVSFSFMSRKLGVHESTICREIKRNLVEERNSKRGDANCANSWRCETRALCDAKCEGFCKECAEVDCTVLCEDFEKKECPRTLKKPYVCNGCAAVQYGADCGFSRRFYDAEYAQKKAEERLSAARSGIDLTSEELEAMVAVVRPLLKQGQSLEHIWATHPGEFPITFRTFYTYIEDNILDICNIELPKKVKYKKRKRKSKKGGLSLNPLYDGRRYDDFALLPEEVKSHAIEMDCVESARGSKKVILTILFRHCNFQCMALLEEQTRVCVQEVLDDIERAIGLEAFRQQMGVWLTDYAEKITKPQIIRYACWADKSAA